MHTESAMMLVRLENFDTPSEAICNIMVSLSRVPSGLPIESTLYEYSYVNSTAPSEGAMTVDLGMLGLNMLSLRRVVFASVMAGINIAAASMDAMIFLFIVFSG